MFQALSRPAAPKYVRYRIWALVVFWGSRRPVLLTSQQQLFLDQRPVPLQGPPPGLRSGQDPRDGGGSWLPPPAERAEREGAQVGIGCGCGGGVARPGKAWGGKGVPEVGFEAAGIGCWHLFSKGADSQHDPKGNRKTLGWRQGPPLQPPL